MKNYTDSTQDIPNLLIVDDVLANLKVLGEILKKEGYKVRPVPTGQLALEVAQKEKPDLILLDIMMPIMDGYEVCSRLKKDKTLRDIPVIFISALNETDDIVRALNSGGADYITKPFQAEEVKARVATHIKLYQQSKKLIELNAIKNKFFSIIAHDLKSPFTGLLGLSELMVTDNQDLTLSEFRQYSNSMHRTVVNIYKLLENLLEWAQVQNNSLSFDPKEIDLRELFSECVASIEQSALQKEVTIINEIPAGQKVCADEKMLNSILGNLLSNALKFSRRNGTIVGKAKADDDGMIEVSIADTGVGMPESMIQKLFKLGERVSNIGTDGELSTGLGLLLCKEFVEKHNGKIWVESQVGGGSVFHFTLMDCDNSDF